MGDQTKTDGTSQADQALDLALTFAPDWARQEPNVRHARDKRARDDRDAFVSTGYEKIPQRGRNAKEHRGEHTQRRKRLAPEHRSDEAFGRKTGAQNPDRPDSFRPNPAESPPDRQRTNTEASGRYQQSGRSGARTHADNLPPLAVDIRIMPEHHALSAIMRRIVTSKRAYPLRDIAWLFLDKPEACLVRLSMQPGAGNPKHLFQCRRCGLPAMEDGELENHFIDAHFDDYFNEEEIPVDPPKGNFTCVARDDSTGEILGPPNYHGTNERIKQILRDRNDETAEEVFRSRLTMLHDPESIEAWRQQSRVRRVYHLRHDSAVQVEKPGSGAGIAPGQQDETPPAETDDAAAPENETETTMNKGLERPAAEFLLMRDIVPGQIARVAHVTIPASTAMRTPCLLLAEHLRAAAAREQKFPVAMIYALRGAFRNKKLHMFKAKDTQGPDFVMAHAPAPLDPNHAVPEIKLILEYIERRPGCSTRDLLEEVSTDVAINSSPGHLATQLAWLVEKGHVIEYFDGSLVSPQPHPHFHANARRHKSDYKHTKKGRHPASSESESIPENHDINSRAVSSAG